MLDVRFKMIRLISLIVLAGLISCSDSNKAEAIRSEIFTKEAELQDAESKLKAVRSEINFVCGSDRDTYIEHLKKRQSEMTAEEIAQEDAKTKNLLESYNKLQDDIEVISAEIKVLNQHLTQNGNE
jgi:peptidoglycan hydrolase CwlO-like protein